MEIWENRLQQEGAASAKALRHREAWWVKEAGKRPPWLEPRKKRVPTRIFIF